MTNWERIFTTFNKEITSKTHKPIEYVLVGLTHWALCPKLNGVSNYAVPSTFYFDHNSLAPDMVDVINYIRIQSPKSVVRAINYPSNFSYPKNIAASAKLHPDAVSCSTYNGYAGFTNAVINYYKPYLNNSSTLHKDNNVIDIWTDLYVTRDGLHPTATVANLAALRLITGLNNCKTYPQAACNP